MEKTFRAGEKARARVMTPSRLADAVRGQVDSADMNKSVNQFTYVDGDQCVALPPAAASEAALTARPLRHRYVFMNLDSFEETRLPRVRLCQLRGLPLQRLTPPSRQDDAWAKYLKEGANVNLLTWNGKVIDVETPNNVVLKARPPAPCTAGVRAHSRPTSFRAQVVDTAGSDKGNTKDGGSKAATLETGAVIQVPLFINVGEEIMVDTRQDLYLSRQGGASF